MASVHELLLAVEAEITAIYGRSCKGAGDHPRLAHLKREKERLSGARQRERAKGYNYADPWGDNNTVPVRRVR